MWMRYNVRFIMRTFGRVSGMADSTDDGRFAAASFGEQDAGSGPVHSSPTIGPVRTALHNITARHLHEIGTAVPDERQFLRSWRRQLQDCITKHNSGLLKFLLADISGSSLPASEIYRRTNDMLTKYSRPTWNFASSIADLSISRTLSSTLETIERDLGMHPQDLREIQRRAIRMYVDAAGNLGLAENALEEKLKRIDTSLHRLNNLMFIEPTAELEGLAAPLRQYSDSLFEKLTLEDDYRTVEEQYKRFAVLRGIVSLQEFQQQSSAPTCSICMTNAVSQCVIPCGHTYCDGCAGRQQVSCYMCRVMIRDRVRIYFA
jgi:hypothetical protein